MKNPSNLWKITKVFGIIITFIGVIISIPVFLAGAVVLCVMFPGIKLWQISDDRLDEDDKDEPIEVKCGCSGLPTGGPKCAK